MGDGGLAQARKPLFFTLIPVIALLSNYGQENWHGGKHWLSSAPLESMYIGVITLGEIRYGIELLQGRPGSDGLACSIPRIARPFDEFCRSCILS